MPSRSRENLLLSQRPPNEKLLFEQQLAEVLLHI